jgi:uncharacterized protein YjbI with pentapeptide repeats
MEDIMEAKIISESKLLQQISLHKEWLRSQNTHSLIGEQLILTDSLISDIKIGNEEITDIELVRCMLSGVSFYDCDLSRSIFIDSLFNDCSFVNCKFIKSDFRGVNGSGADFSRSDFTRADFTTAILKHANFTGCKLNWAWFVKSDLRYSTLDQVEMEGTRFIEAKMYNDKIYSLKSAKDIVAEDIDISPDGDNTHITGIASIELHFRE